MKYFNKKMARQLIVSIVILACALIYGNAQKDIEPNRLPPCVENYNAVFSSKN